MMPDVLPPLLTGDAEEDTTADQNDFEQQLRHRLRARVGGRRPFVIVELRDVNIRHRAPMGSQAVSSLLLAKSAHRIE